MSVKVVPENSLSWTDPFDRTSASSVGPPTGSGLCPVRFAQADDTDVVPPLVRTPGRTRSMCSRRVAPSGPHVPRTERLSGSGFPRIPGASGDAFAPHSQCVNTGAIGPEKSGFSVLTTENPLRIVRLSLCAGVAQLVEHHLAKVDVVSSSLIARSTFLTRGASCGFFIRRGFSLP